jgi:hypothetical protein
MRAADAGMIRFAGIEIMIDPIDADGFQLPGL